MPKWASPGGRGHPGPGCAQKGSYVTYFGAFPSGLCIYPRGKRMSRKRRLPGSCHGASPSVLA